MSFATMQSLTNTKALLRHKSKQWKHKKNKD
ncbi:hypothetical protein BCEN4_740097 [Burkholderia cenocepacia]|nr:hypothetical protein BCEN4_740097 [Burkholderia cenocepacia]